MTTSTAARIWNGLRRRWQYSEVKAPPGVVLRELNVAGRPLLLGDLEGSVAVEVVAGEIGHEAYDFSDIEFRPGDTVIDLGAHLGVVSIYLAKEHPGLNVLAFEPMPRVFELLEENLRRNRVHNVHAFNMAVSGDGRDIDLVAHLDSNTGGGTSYVSTMDLPGHQRVTVPSMTLDRIFEDHAIRRCPLLKIDIEGGEYEVLRSTRILDRIENIRGEFHENTYLRDRGCTMVDLRSYCEASIGEGHVRYTECYMADV